MKSLTTLQSYKKLVKDISFIYDRARKVLVESYLEIGRLIVEEEQRGKLRVEYDSHLIDNLSKDLLGRYGSGFSYRNIANMRKFYLSYPILQAPAELTWTHYQLLSNVENKKDRASLEAKALLFAGNKSAQALVATKMGRRIVLNGLLKQTTSKQVRPLALASMFDIATIQSIPVSVFEEVIETELKSIRFKQSA